MSGPYDPPCSGCGLNCGGRCFTECEADYDPPEMTLKQLREKYAPDLRADWVIHGPKRNDDGSYSVAA